MPRFLLLFLYVLNFEHVCQSGGNLLAMADSTTEEASAGTTGFPVVTSSQFADNATATEDIALEPSPSTPSRLPEQSPSLISKEQYKRWSDVMWRVLFPITGVCGFALDGLGLAVLCKIRNYNPFHICLFALLIFDEIYLLVLLLWCIPRIAEPYDMFLTNYLNAYTYQALNSMTSMTYAICSNFITFMSIERFIKVFFPYKASIIITRKITMFVLIGIVGCNIAIMMPAFFVMRGEPYFDQEHNRTMYMTTRTEWAIANKAFIPHYATGIAIVTKITPFMILLFCNIGICVQLSRFRKDREKLFSNTDNSRQHAEQMRMTVTLMLMSVFLALSLLPSSISFIMSVYMPDVYGRSGTQAILRQVIADSGEYMQVVSASNDFIIFICASKHTRDILKGMSCWKCCHGLENTPSVLQSSNQQVFQTPVAST